MQGDIDVIDDIFRKKLCWNNLILPNYGAQWLT